jgi:hypothetical protein
MQTVLCQYFTALSLHMSILAACHLGLWVKKCTAQECLVPAAAPAAVLAAASARLAAALMLTHPGSAAAVPLL